MGSGPYHFVNFHANAVLVEITAKGGEQETAAAVVLFLLLLLVVCGEVTISAGTRYSVLFRAQWRRSTGMRFPLEEISHRDPYLPSLVLARIVTETTEHVKLYTSIALLLLDTVLDALTAMIKKLFLFLFLFVPVPPMALASHWGGGNNVGPVNGDMYTGCLYIVGAPGRYVK